MEWFLKNKIFFRNSDVKGIIIRKENSAKQTNADHLFVLLIKYHKLTISRKAILCKNIDTDIVDYFSDRSQLIIDYTE
jgi:hypothetical protein